MGAAVIHLARAVKVSSIDVEATVAVGRDRREFLAVAQLAADLARPIGARDLLQELIGPRPDVVGWRVIERCVDLGLLERTEPSGPARLSESGRLALAHGEVLVPEEGLWRMFVVDDPLVSCALIHAKRLESQPVYRERQMLREARAERRDIPRPDRPSDLLRREVGARPRVSVQDEHLLQLRELADRGANGPRGELRLVLTWVADAAAPALRLVGRLPADLKVSGGEAFDAVLELPEIFRKLSYQLLWSMLVNLATGVGAEELDRWRAAAGKPVVPVRFESLAAPARQAFQLDLPVPASEWTALGDFEAGVLKGVHLVPASEPDAQAWLSWLQWEAITDHVTPVDLEQKAKELRMKFPHHHPRPQVAGELLARARSQRDDRSWFVLGPSDLGLWS
jgi:hypothetical protein